MPRRTRGGRTSPLKIQTLTPMIPYLVLASARPNSMSARSVWRGTRPSRYVSTRLISLPPRRPEQRTRTPLAPNFIAVESDFFIARRNATRRLSWVAMFSATSCAAVSALRTSWTSMKTSFSVNDCTPAKTVSPLAAGFTFPPLRVSVPLAPLADDHPRPSREDDDLALVGRALDLDARDARVHQIVLHGALDTHV